MDWIRAQLIAGRVAQVIAALKPYCDRSKAIAACIRYYGTNALLAVKCCLESRCWADCLEWRACRIAPA